MHIRNTAIRSALAAGAAALAIAGAGCGSSDDGSSQGTTSGATKSPIKVGLIVDATSATSLSWPQTMQAGRVIAQSINDRGGIDGHPIDVVSCDSKLDPNAATNCARQIAKAGVAATLMWGINTDRVLQVMEPAGIPSFSLFPSFPAEFNSRVSFPLFSSIPINPGLGVLAGQQCKKARLLQVQSPYADPTLAYVNAGFTSIGRAPIDAVNFDPTTTDFAPTVAQATNGVDCLIMVVTAQQAAAIYPAIKQTGKPVRVLGVGGSDIDASLIKRFPDVLEGAMAVGDFPPTDEPQWDGFRDIADRYAHGTDEIFGASSAGTYVVYQVMRDAIERVLRDGEQVTPATLTAALEQTRGATAGGLLPGIALDPANPSPIKGLPRMFNANVVFSTVRDGKLVPLDGGRFQDMTDALAGASGK